MTSQSWRSLVNSKYQLSLRLFLFLNATSAVFSVTNPLYSVPQFPMPLFAIFAISSGLLLWHWKNRTRKVNISVVSSIFGSLWAWQIVSKFLLITHDQLTYLIMALLTVLFIGSLSFASNIKAFILHSLPAFIACLWLSNHENWLRMTYSFACLWWRLVFTIFCKDVTTISLRSCSPGYWKNEKRLPISV